MKKINPFKKAANTVANEISMNSWLKKDECIQYYDCEVSSEEIANAIPNVMARDGIEVSVKPQPLVVDGIQQNGDSYIINAGNTNDAPKLYLNVSKIGNYTAVKQATYLRPPKDAKVPGHIEEVSNMVAFLVSIAVGLGLILAGIQFRRLQVIKLFDEPININIPVKKEDIIIDPMAN